MITNLIFIFRRIFLTLRWEGNFNRKNYRRRHNSSKWVNSRVNLMGLKKIQTKESSRSRSGNPIWRLIIVLSFSSSEPKVELQTMTVKLPIGCLTKFKISLRQFLVKGVENQRNECRISFFDNVYFRPSKMKIVTILTSHFTRCTTFHCFASFCTAHTDTHDQNQNHLIALRSFKRSMPMIYWLSWGQVWVKSGSSRGQIGSRWWER